MKNSQIIYGRPSYTTHFYKNHLGFRLHKSAAKTSKRKGKGKGKLISQYIHLYILSKCNNSKIKLFKK